MRYGHFMRNTLIVILTAALCSCSQEKGEKKKAGPSTASRTITISEEGLYGWDSVMLRNTFVKFDVVPELGGKIMGYDLQGYQILWHDPVNEGKLYTDVPTDAGGKFYNPGGAKVWPAPQGWSGSDEWPGPPDEIIDGSPYEHTATPSMITVTSPKDDGDSGTGLQFSHSYSLRSGGTVVDLELTMTNVINRNVKWGLWHLATLPVDRKFTVYVPVDKGNWHVIFGAENNPQWLGIEDGLFRARYEQQVGKVGLKVREGWAAWHDEDNNVVFVMMFPIRKGMEYPDGGSNVALYTEGSGTVRYNDQDHAHTYNPQSAFIELEVMGPVMNIASGNEATLDVNWALCKCSGVKKVVPAGVIVEDLKYESDVVTGKFGVFYSGYLQLVYLDRNGKQIGLKNLMDVSPLTEVNIKQESRHLVTSAYAIRYQLMKYDKEIVGEFGTVKLQ